ERASAMTHAMLLLRGQFAEAAAERTDPEQRIVPEPPGTGRSVQDSAAARADAGDRAGARADERRGAHVMRAALLVRQPGEMFEQAGIVGIVECLAGKIRAAGETLRADARLTVECVHADARIIRNGRQAGACSEIPGLGECVLVERIEHLDVVCLGSGCDAQTAEVDEFTSLAMQAQRAAEDRPDLLELVMAARGDNDGLRHHSASAARCAARSCSMPAMPRSISWSSCSRVKLSFSP